MHSYKEDEDWGGGGMCPKCPMLDPPLHHRQQKLKMWFMLIATHTY